MVRNLKRLIETGLIIIARPKYRSCIAFLLILCTLIIFVDSACDPNKKYEEQAALLGVSPELHKQMMRDDPLYRSLVNGPDYKERTKQFLSRIKRKYKQEDLLQWAQKLLDEHREDKHVTTITRPGLPDFIINIDPPLEPVVIVFPRSHILIDWGGGWGHWGLFVGPNVIPNNTQLYFIMWGQGVYAYHTTQ